MRRQDFGRGSFDCHDCGEIFSHRSSLHRHIDERHRSQHDFPCNQCHKVYNRRDNLLAHMKRDHKEGQEERLEGRGKHPGGSKDREKVRGHTPDRRVDRHDVRHIVKDRSSRGKYPEKRQAQRPKSEAHVSQADVEIQVDVSPATQEAVEARVPKGKPLSMLRQQVANQDDSSDTCDSSGSDSESDDEPQPKRFQLGTEIDELTASNVMSGTVVMVTEHSSSSLFCSEAKLSEETKERTYKMVVVKPAQTSEKKGFATKLRHVDGEALGNPMSLKEVENGLIGKVKEIREVVTRKLFKDGNLFVEDTNSKVYSVDLLTGTTDSH